MARYTGPVCRLCRREGTKLFLKGERCMTGKCALDRRSTAPGQHGAANKTMREYGVQFREKQILVKNHTQEITVVNRGYNEYYFLYMAYGVDGAESAKFASADFTLEPV